MPPIQNVYYERKVGTAKQCYVCRNPTTTVLATVDTVSWIYACPKHLDDSGFATLILPKVEEPSGPTKEDIAKVIEEHKQQEARRLEKSKEKDKDGKEKTENKGDEETKKKPAVPVPLPIDVTGASATPKHRQFVLHRGIFSMLEREAKSREQGAKAKEVGKGLPQVPSGRF